MDVWELGDYRIVGDWFADASRSVLHGGSMPASLAGRSVIDVACGTGAVGLAAARDGASVICVDSSPRMLDEARRRASEAEVDLRFERRSFTELDGLAPADVVASSFGVMFAEDPSAVARQLDAVCAPHGVIGVAAWHPGGALGGPPPALVELIGAGPVDITLWSDAERVAEFFGATGRRVAHHRRDTIPIPFAGVDDAIASMRRHSGPWIAMFDQLDERTGAEATEILASHLRSTSRETDAGIELRADYTVTHLARP